MIRLEDTQYLREMAKITAKGDLGKIEVWVRSDDHGFPHCHIIKESEYEVKYIILGKNKGEYTYKYGKGFEGKDKNDFEVWITAPFKNDNRLTNLEAMIIFWNTYQED